VEEVHAGCLDTVFIDLNLKKKNTSHDKVSAIMRAQRDHLRIKYGMRDDDDRAMEKKPHKV